MIANVLRPLVLAGVAAIGATVLAPTSRASVVFDGNGTNAETGTTKDAAEAKFTISGNTLTVVLTNTTAFATPAQGDALTGVEFNLTGTDGNATPLTLSSSSPTLTAGSKVYTDYKTAANPAPSLAGAWTYQLAKVPSPAGFSYGIATTGFNGEFNGNTFSQGNSSPDYGIVSAGTFPAASSHSFGGSKYPFIQNSLTFVYTGASGISESQITGVSFLFGTAGTGRINAGSSPPPPPAVPEPATLVSAVLGLIPVGLLAGRRALRRGEVTSV